MLAREIAAQHQDICRAFVTMNDCFTSKATKISSLSWRRNDRFTAQNGKDQPNPRAARVRQEVATENRRMLKKVMFVLIDRLLGAFPIGRGLINKVRWTLRIQGRTWFRSMPCRTGIQLQN